MQFTFFFVLHNVYFVSLIDIAARFAIAPQSVSVSLPWSDRGRDIARRSILTGDVGTGPRGLEHINSV